MTVALSDMQSRAMAAIRDWYETRRHEPWLKMGDGA
jgi:exodeoxyribonuclease-5